jgi:excisionase family DNA binding protein
MNEKAFQINTNECLLNVRDIVRILNISRSLAYRLVQSGEIPSVRIKSSVRIRKQDLDAFIQKSWTGWQVS